MARAERNAKGQKSRKSQRLSSCFFSLPAEPFGFAATQPQKTAGLVL
jgi:hypothetical protein